MKVGFVGIGNMGSGMALNLIRKNFQVSIFDKAGETSLVLDLKKSGAAVAPSVKGIASDSEVLISMVPATRHVEDLYLSNDGILASLSRKNVLLMDCSTIDPIASRRIGDACRQAGHRFLDAPVSGGILGARSGTLTFMVGAGSEEEFQSAAHVLSAMGKPINCGGWGKGAAVKVCNNLILAASMLGVSEGYGLAKKLGVDLKIFDQIVNTSSGKCWSSEQYNPVPGLKDGVPSSRNYQGGFAVNLMVKDLGLAVEAADGVGASTAVAEFCKEQYGKVSQKGHGDLDFSSVFKFLNEE